MSSDSSISTTVAAIKLPFRFSQIVNLSSYCLNTLNFIYAASQINYTMYSLRPAFRLAVRPARTLTTSTRTCAEKGMMEQAGEMMKKAGQAFKVGLRILTLTVSLERHNREPFVDTLRRATARSVKSSRRTERSAVKARRVSQRIKALFS